MPVAIDEKQGSPRFSSTEETRSATREYLTDWADIDAHILELMPPTTPVGLSAGQQPTAGFPGNPFLRVSNVTVQPEGAQRTATQNVFEVNTYEKAHWTVQYDTPDYSIGQQAGGEQGNDPVPFLSHTWSGGGEFLTLPTEAAWWATTPTEVNDEVNAGIFIPTIEHQITWHRVVNPPFATIRSTIGKVNSDSVQLRTGTATPETLLFHGPELRIEVMSGGQRSWAVTYKFSERRVTGAVADDANLPTGGGAGGWNHFWRNDVSPAGFYRMTRGGWVVAANADPIYELATFADLWQV